MNKLSIRAALLLAAVALAACTTGPGGSPSVSVNPSLASAGASSVDAFCSVDLASLTQLQAAVNDAEKAAAGQDVTSADVAKTVDAAITELNGIQTSGSNATLRDALVSALQSFKAGAPDPDQVSAQSVVAAHTALTTAQDACP